MSNDEMIKYRLESLKMAYETNLKMGSIKFAYNSGDKNKINDAILDVFDLSEINLEYIINGERPSFYFEKDVNGGNNDKI